MSHCFARKLSAKSLRQTFWDYIHNFQLDSLYIHCQTVLSGIQRKIGGKCKGSGGGDGTLLLCVDIADSTEATTRTFKIACQECASLYKQIQEPGTNHCMQNGEKHDLKLKIQEADCNLIRATHRWRRLCQIQHFLF